ERRCSSTGRFNDFLRQVDGSVSARAEDVGCGTRDLPRGTVVVHNLDFFGRVGPELIYRHDRRLAELGGAVEVRSQVFESSFDGAWIRVFQSIELHAAVHFKGSNCRDQHDGGRIESARAALEIEELFAAQVKGKAGLGDGIVGGGQRHARGQNRVASVGDVG